MKSIVNNKVLITAGAFIFTLVCILWEHFHGGVITHHLLARQDLPGLSNWWGLLTIPLLFWLSLSLIQRRRDQQVITAPNAVRSDSDIVKNFLVALVFGLIASLMWEFRVGDILQYYILLPILIAFFKPIHIPEYLCGFVIGMLFTFGGILPIIVGTVLIIIGFLINGAVRLLKNLISSNK